MYVIYDGSDKNQPDSIRLAPYDRLFKGVVTEIPDEAEKHVLAMPGVKKTTAPKSDDKAKS